MKLPNIFCQVHGDQIFSSWISAGQPPFVRVAPREPLGHAPWRPETMPDSVTIVTVRCWNDHGVMKYEAASPDDLKAAQEWSKKHRDSQPEDFKWLPSFTAD